MAEVRRYFKSANVTLLVRKQSTALDVYLMPGRVLRSPPQPADLLASLAPSDMVHLVAMFMKLENDPV